MNTAKNQAQHGPLPFEYKVAITLKVAFFSASIFAAGVFILSNYLSAATTGGIALVSAGVCVGAGIWHRVCVKRRVPAGRPIWLFCLGIFIPYFAVFIALYSGIKG